MYNFYNSSIIYVSQLNGDDNNYSGFAPAADGNGNGPFKTLKKAIVSLGQLQVTGYNRPMTIALVDDYFLSETIKLDCAQSVHKKRFKNQWSYI